jgi:large subunit ribosomal protein L9
MKMEVILLTKVENLGNIGDKVKVRAGYGRNYLIPTGKAQPATAENLAAFEVRRAELEKQAAAALAAAQARAGQIGALGGTIEITAKVGSEGRLFGSIGTVDISEAFAAKGVEVERGEVRLPHGPLREVGEHEIVLHLHTDVNVDFKIIIVGEE